MLQMINLREDSHGEQADVSSAFLSAEVDYKVFCDIPIGHENDVCAETGVNYDQTVCWRLRRSIYGLHQSSRAFNQLLNKLMKEVGFFPIPCDTGSFVKHGKHGGWCVCTVHVDDLFIFYNKAGKVLRDDMRAGLTKHLKVKFLGELDWALKCRIHRDKEAGIIKFEQEAFVWEFLTRHGLLDIKGADSPADPDVQLPAPEEVTDDEVRKWELYPIREIVGCYLWLARMSRPDILIAVLIASRTQHRPSQALWKWLIRIARYLKTTAHFGLVYQRPKDFDESKTRVFKDYVDISFAPWLPFNKGKSLVGLCIMFYTACVDWDASKTSRVCLSTAEGECHGLVVAWKADQWHRALHHYLKILKKELGPTLFMEDNTSSITLSGSNTFHKRSKHFEIEWYKVKEAVNEKIMELEWCSTKDQAADMLTKPTVGAHMFHQREIIMGPDILQEYFGKMVPPEV